MPPLLFSLSPLSLSSLLMALGVTLLLVYRWQRPRLAAGEKVDAERWLLAYFGFMLLALALNFVSASLPFWGEALAPLPLAAWLAGYVCLGAFGLRGKREGALALAGLGALALAETGYSLAHLHRFLTAWTPGAGELAGAGAALPLVATLALGVGLRRSRSPLTTAAAVGLLPAAALLPGLPLPGSAWGELRSLLSLASLGGLLMLAALVWAYFSLTARPATFLARLVGVVLFTYLVFFLPVAFTQLESIRRDLDTQRRQTSYLVYQSILAGRLTAPYPDVAYVANWNTTSGAAALTLAYARPDLAAPALQTWLQQENARPEARLDALDLFTLAGPAQDTAQPGGLQLQTWALQPRYLAYPAGSRPVYQAHLFQFGENIYEVGYAHADALQALHQHVLSLVSTGLLSVILIFVLFPAIFQPTLLEPLRRLAVGAARVASGDLETRVPLGAQDELGALGQAFNEMTAALQARTAELARANQRVQHEVEERQRLARSLHDSVTQSVYGLALLARGAQELAAEGQLEAAQSELAVLEAEALAALREMRLLVYELRPLALQETGLREALRERLEVVERRAGLQITFDMPAGLSVPPEAEVEIYYLVIEALNNILKHAQAARVTVTFARLDAALHLTIQDDGRGFDPATQPAGFGLRSIRERAARLGAALTIESAPGTGTTIKMIYSIYDLAVSSQKNGEGDSHLYI